MRSAPSPAAAAGCGRMAAAAGGGGGGPGPGPGPGSGAGVRKGGAARDAEAEVWCRRVREVVSSAPANRLCFECGQRGVTYVDITVGSLVCTGCSGALRGLNPPHRVKSISMTTFSEAEVLFLQAHGNEACRRVWLGTFDARSTLPPDSRDPQKLKEFLQEKYEKKRWYVAPEQSKPAAEAAPPPPLLGEGGPPPACPPPPPQPAPQRPPQPARKASADLLADIGGDPFAAPPPAPAFAPFPAFPGPSPAAFAHFDAFGAGSGAPAFGGAAPPFHAPPAPTGGAAVRGGASGAGGGASGPPGGGASASLFGTLRTPPALPQPPHGASTNPFTTPLPSTNPFQSNGLAAGSAFSMGPPTAFTAPPGTGGFAAPFQADASAFSGFSVGKASTNPFVTVPAPATPFGIKHPATNPFL